MIQKLLQSLFRVRFSSRMRQFEGIPGPMPCYPIGTIGDFYGADPWEVFADYGAKYGGMSLAWLGGTPTVVLNNPRLIGEVLDTNSKEYYKNYPIRALRPVLRGTIFNFNKPEWDRLRKGHPCKIEGFDRWLPTQFSVIKKVAERHLNAMLSTDKEMEPVDKMQRLCFDAFNACACGPDFEDGGFENFYILSEMATFRMKFPQFMLIPPIRPRFHRAMRLHYGAYDKAVKKARQSPDASANDLLQVLLRQGTDFSDSEIVDSLSDFQAGGDISTASALVNTFYLLSENPVVAKRLYDDLAEMTRRNPDFDQATLDQVPLLDHVLRESLRMIPPVAINSRNTLKDRSVTLGGHALPPDTTVMILTKAVQRSAKHWKDPDTFNPDRWANGGVEANPLGSDYFFPFGRGPRTCAGADFAMFCMKIILASILSRAALKTSGPFRGIYHCGVVEAKKLKARLIAHASKSTRE
jgi:cytochrome P450